jgi:Topoisomerase IA
MTVCIAEKHSVAGDIAKVLGANSRKDGYYEGNGYQVTWTYGHLCCLKSPEEYNSDWKKWSLQQLPMIPNRFGIKLIPEAGIKKQFGSSEALRQRPTPSSTAVMLVRKENSSSVSRGSKAHEG